jgi:hypothetical protein
MKPNMENHKPMISENNGITAFKKRSENIILHFVI